MSEDKILKKYVDGKFETMIQYMDKNYIEKKDFNRSLNLLDYLIKESQDTKKELITFGYSTEKQFKKINKLLSNISRRLESIDKKFENTDYRLNSLENTLDV